MEKQGPQQVRIQIPAEVMAQIQMKMAGQFANAIVIGDYEGAEVIPDSHKLLIGEMLLTLAQNPALETAPCEHCSEIRLEHPLDVQTGFRYCKPEKQPQPSAEDPTSVPEKHRFNPVMRRVVAPSDEKRIIIPGR